MRPAEVTYFAITLFLALVALIHWKRRRRIVTQRLNRGLRGYVATEDPSKAHAHLKPLAGHEVRSGEKVMLT